MDTNRIHVCSVEHRLYRSMVGGTYIAKRSLSSIKIDLSTFVKEYFHRPLTKDSQHKFIAHRIDSPDFPSQDRALPSGRGRQGRRNIRRTRGLLRRLRGHGL